MIHYFYHLDYDETVSESSEIAPRLLNSMVYALADKYIAPGLKKLARVRFALCHSTYSPTSKVSKHVFESTTDSDFGLRDLVLLRHATVFYDHSRKLAWDEKRLGRFMERCRDHLVNVPAVASELTLLAMFLLFRYWKPVLEAWGHWY